MITIDGQSHEALLNTIQPLRNRKLSKPTVIIAETVKGEGVDSICYDPMWHGAAPKGKTAAQCLEDLEKKYGNG